MFNIGKLRAESAEYYLGVVAPTVSDYYVGAGEAAGRWAGSLAPELGLVGAVDPDEFRRLLAGLEPRTGDVLVSAAGSNARARGRVGGRAAPARPGAKGLEVAHVAAQLRVSTRAVRQWVAAGERIWDDVARATPTVVLTTPAQVRARLAQLTAAGSAPAGASGRFVLGWRVPAEAPGGSRQRWSISQSEVDELRDRRPVAAQAGWDLVFRPPKSYSILWAVGGETLSQQIHAIHQEAVDAALGYLEDAAVAARAAHLGKVVRTEVDGLVVAVFDHRDSRAGDPLLHSHCVVANVTRRGDGRWVALDPRGFFRHGRAADAVYQATFRHLTERRLGLEAEPVINGWADIIGVPRPVIEHFSKRSEEIAAEIARAGSNSARARQAAALATRAPKDHGRDQGGLHVRWQAEAAAIGFDAAAVAACLDRAPTVEADRVLNEARVEFVFDRLAGPDGLTAEATTFGRPEVITALAAALGGAVDGLGVVALADRFLASERVCLVPEHRPGQPRARILARHGAFVTDLASAAFTTPGIVEIEERLIAATRGGPSRPGPVVPEVVVQAVLDRRPELSGEQAAMVQAVCGSPGVLRAVVGFPGAGKTYGAEAAVAAFRAAGIPVLGCAVTAEAADELARATGRGAGAGSACDTLARLLLDLDHPRYGGLPPGAVVLLDEASTVSHRDLDRLLTHVGRAGGALVMIGDPKQHGAVGAGHFFGWLVERSGEAGVVTLRANHRQRDLLDPAGNVVVSLAAERLANADYREGRIAEALARRDDDGKVVRAATAGELYDAMTADWFVSWQAGSQDPMVAGRNSVREELNRRARVLRAAAGELSGPVVEAGGRQFQAGEFVVTRKNHRHLSAPDGWFVKNGSRGVVTHADPTTGALVVDFEAPSGATHRVRLPAGYVAEYVQWAYAVTDYGVQGRTLDRTRAVLDDTTSAAGAYVAMTRGRLENRLYIVDGSLTGDHDPDVAHGRPPERESSLEVIAAHLAAQSPEPLVHEIDPWVTPSATLARAADLADLRSTLDDLDGVAASAPPDVSRRLAGLARREEELQSRRRLLDNQPPTDAEVASKVARRLAAIDRTLSVTATRRQELEGVAAERRGWLDDHAGELADRNLLRDALAVREAKVRLAAPDRLPRAFLAQLPPPTAQTTLGERRLWRHAVETAATYRERWGIDTNGPVDGTSSGSVPTWLVGPCPDDPAARREWDRATAAIRSAAIDRTAEATVASP